MTRTIQQITKHISISGVATTIQLPNVMSLLVGKYLQERIKMTLRSVAALKPFQNNFPVSLG